MNATEFARRRGRIEHQGVKKHAWKVKALRQLVNDARAVLVTVEGRVVGYRLPNGQVVCAKQRYKDQDTALRHLDMIQLCDGTHQKPVRAYPCPQCRGWHRTSRA